MSLRRSEVVKGLLAVGVACAAWAVAAGGGGRATVRLGRRGTYPRKSNHPRRVGDVTGICQFVHWCT